MAKMGRGDAYDLDKEAQDLLDWSLLDTSLTLYGFTDDKRYCTQDLFIYARRNENFNVALKKAKNRIAKRREEHVNDEMMNSVVYAKTIHNYDTIADDHDDEKEERKFKRDIRRMREASKLSEKNSLPPQPPNQLLLDQAHENMELKAQLAESQKLIESLKEKNNDHQC